MAAATPTITSRPITNCSTTHHVRRGGLGTTGVEASGCGCGAEAVSPTGRAGRGCGRWVATGRGLGGIGVGLEAGGGVGAGGGAGRAEAGCGRRGPISIERRGSISLTLRTGFCSGSTQVYLLSLPYNTTDDVFRLWLAGSSPFRLPPRPSPSDRLPVANLGAT